MTIRTHLFSIYFTCVSFIDIQFIFYRYESTKAGLSRLAKLLTSKDKSSSNKNTCQFPSTIPNM